MRERATPLSHCTRTRHTRTPPPLTSMSASAASDAISKERANQVLEKYEKKWPQVLEKYDKKYQSCAKTASREVHSAINEQARDKEESASDSEDNTNGGVYCGNFDQNELPHGQGTKDFANGDKFVGIWHHGRMKSGAWYNSRLFDGKMGLLLSHYRPRHYCRDILLQRWQTEEKVCGRFRRE